MTTESGSARPARKAFGPKLIVSGVVALVVIGAALLFFGVGGKNESAPTTFAARQGPLDIVVLEGGSVEALESQEVKSEVAGWQGTKILFIVEEGIYVTEEDVENEMKLVELDSSELREKLTTSEIQFKSTQASMTEAHQGYDIQISKSESDIYASELELKFALLELEKFLGRDVTGEILAEIRAAEENRREAEELMKAEKAADEQSIATALLNEELSEGKEESTPMEAKESGEENAEPEDAAVEGEEAREANFELSLTHLRMGHPKIDFLSFAAAEVLGDGEAGQKIRELDDKLILARKELGLANTDFQGQQRLYDRDFVTRNELENSRMSVDKSEIGVNSAETGKRLFLEYEFPKQAEKLSADYIQAIRKLQRTEKQALSELAQAEAKLLSSEARYNIEKVRIEDYREQIGKCIMTAETAGLVVYGGSGRNYWNSEPIKEGATIRERQSIITIPDMSKMAVKVKIHESEVKRVEKGQQARVRIDAFPDRVLHGEVQKVAVLPDAENRWMNPDLKVYETVVTIEGVHEWLKPGMNAKVEILVTTLENAIYIPIQSVVPDGKEQVCFVLTNGEVERRIIETGPVTVEYITVTKGLEPGEQVLIRPPVGSRNDDTEEERMPWEEKEEKEEKDKEGAEDSTETAEAEVVTPVAADAGAS